MRTPYVYSGMKLPPEILEEFRRQGRRGGKARADAMTPEERSAAARRAATTRWVRQRFGADDFATLGLPGGELIDAGLADLSQGLVTPEALLVSLAAPRLRREGVPVGRVESDPEQRLFVLLQELEGELAHARYNALLRRTVSFADACRGARVDL